MKTTRGKGYPTIEELRESLKNYDPKTGYKKVAQQFKEIPQDPYGGVCVESLVISNLMESVSRFDFRDLEI